MKMLSETRTISCDKRKMEMKTTSLRNTCSESQRLWRFSICHGVLLLLFLILIQAAEAQDTTTVTTTTTTATQSTTAEMNTETEYTTEEPTTTTPPDCGPGGTWEDGQCSCDGGYYSNSTTYTCMACNEAITNCITCELTEGTPNCTSCSSYYVPHENGHKCSCEKFYEDTGSECIKLGPCAVGGEHFAICVGVPVGVGVPLIVGVIVGIVLLIRRRNRNHKPPGSQVRKMSILPHPEEIDYVARQDDINNREDSIRNNGQRTENEPEQSMPMTPATAIPVVQLSNSHPSPRDSSGQESYANMEFIRNSPHINQRNPSNASKPKANYVNIEAEKREYERRRAAGGQVPIHPITHPKPPRKASLKDNVPLDGNDNPPPPSAEGHVVKKHAYINLNNLPDNSVSADAYTHKYVNIAEQEANLRKLSSASNRSHKVQSIFPDGVDSPRVSDSASKKSDSLGEKTVEPSVRELTYANIRAQRYS